MKKDFAELYEFLGVKFNFFEEQFALIERRFEGIGERFEKIDERFEKIEGQIAQLPTKAYLDDKLADFKVRNKLA